MRTVTAVGGVASGAETVQAPIQVQSQPAVPLPCSLSPLSCELAMVTS